LKKPKDIPETVCAAAWCHTYVSPQGSRRLCCASRESSENDVMKQYIDLPSKHKGTFNPVSLKGHWNSEYMKDIRRRMMAGEKIPQCQVCNEQLLNLWTYRRYFNETLFPEKFDEIYAQTSEDGSTKLEPISYDYRISNLCNFKCRMCGPPLSSSWEAEKRKYNDWNPKEDPWMIPVVKDSIEKFQKEVLVAELEEAIDRKIIREVYWVGGEPLMWEDHWRLMEKMVQNGVSKDVVIRYNTNLSRVEYKGMRLFEDFLPHFKRVNICASLDATGKIGEFIRTGLVWEEFQENFERGIKFQKEHFPEDKDFLVVDLTLTLPGLFDLPEIVHFANSHDAKVYTKTIFAFDPSIVLSPLALPREILEPFLKEVENRVRWYMNLKTTSVLQTLYQLEERKTFAEMWPDTYEEGLREGKKVQRRLADRRKDGQGGRLTLEEIYGGRDDISTWWLGIG
jgi:hypothetical protein